MRRASSSDLSLHVCMCDSTKFRMLLLQQSPTDMHVQASRYNFSNSYKVLSQDLWQQMLLAESSSSVASHADKLQAACQAAGTRPLLRSLECNQPYMAALHMLCTVEYSHWLPPSNCISHSSAAVQCNLMLQLNAAKACWTSMWPVLHLAGLKGR